MAISVFEKNMNLLCEVEKFKILGRGKWLVFIDIFGKCIYN